MPIESDAWAKSIEMSLNAADTSVRTHDEQMLYEEHPSLIIERNREMAVQPLAPLPRL